MTTATRRPNWSTSTRQSSSVSARTYEFHRYDGAWHGFFYYHTPMYRPEATMDGWGKIFTFFGRYLKG